MTMTLPYDAATVERMIQTRNALEGESWPAFREGFAAMLPLWGGAIPSGIAFGVAAGSLDLSPALAQAMSLVVFSSAAQMSAISTWDSTPWTLSLSAMALSAHLPLLGAAVRERCAPPRRLRFLAAWLLTDGSFGIAAGRGRLRLPVLFGAGFSMYLGWNLGTLLGSVAGNVIPESAEDGLTLVIPLTFLAVLVPALRARKLSETALCAGVVGLLASLALPVGLAVLAAGVAGAILHDRRSRDE
jgi:predicted branched-subunit amino acid permease